MKNRSPYFLAALASAIASDLRIVSVSLTDDLPRMDEGKDIVTGILLTQNGDSYDISVGLDEQACALLRKRAAAARSLRPSGELLRRLGFQLERTVYTGDVKTDDGLKTVLITPQLEGFPRPFESLDVSLCASLGAAIAKIHCLKPDKLMEFGYQTFSGSAIREELETWVDHLTIERDIPRAILNRWDQLITVDALWDFRASLVHGDYRANDVLFLDSGVSAIRNWERLQISDPARDFAWLFEDSISDMQRDAVLSEYGRIMGSHMDSRIVPRARLWRQMNIVTDFLRSLDSMDRVWIDETRIRVENLASILTPITAVTPDNSVNASHISQEDAVKEDANSTVTVGTLLGKSGSPRMREQIQQEFGGPSVRWGDGTGDAASEAVTSILSTFRPGGPAHPNVPSSAEDAARVVVDAARSTDIQTGDLDDGMRANNAAASAGRLAEASARPAAAGSSQSGADGLTDRNNVQPNVDASHPVTRPTAAAIPPDPALAAAMLQTVARAAIANRNGVDLQAEQEKKANLDENGNPKPMSELDTALFSAASFAASQQQSIEADVHVAGSVRLCDAGEPLREPTARSSAVQPTTSKPVAVFNDTYSISAAQAAALQSAKDRHMTIVTAHANSENGSDEIASPTTMVLQATIQSAKNGENK